MSNTVRHTIATTRWQAHRAELIKIRTAVFIQEQQVSAADEWDGLDEQAIHFLVSSASEDAIGCARLLHETLDNNHFYHIGRVAIIKSFRNLGIGHQLLQFVIAYCKKAAPANTIYLHAQTERRLFYETLGFIAEGAEFMDAGMPHITMRLPQ